MVCPENRSNENLISVLFVCMGNICRSPTAEGVFSTMARERGILDLLSIDSAGTHDYHVGRPPDERAQRAARKRNIEIGHLRARQVVKADLVENDYILAMDLDNLNSLRTLSPPEFRHKILLFLDFAPQAVVREVPDPYFGAGDGFEVVLDLVEEASRGLLAEIQGCFVLAHKKPYLHNN